MRFKLILALVEENRVDELLRATRAAGATGATVITSARGEGLVPQKTFLGLTLAGQRDVLLLVVQEHLSRKILETIAEVGCFDTEAGSGIAIQVAIEDAVGLAAQIKELTKKVEDEI